MNCKTCGFAASDPSVTVCPFCKGGVSGGAGTMAATSASVWPPPPSESSVSMQVPDYEKVAVLAQKVRKSNWCVGLAIVCDILAYMLCATRQPPLVICGEICQAAGIVLFLFGCGYYAEWKGYSALFCLLGFLNVFGLLILLLMPNKNKRRV